ncbi:energy transducer TonB [Pseudomonas sp. v388]|uniref:energy transducer TonB n=1 Tax=Pseudomonas sp. v388 TaxID=2479849 RepID=UPI000F79A1B1|nr:energy transducer TonB [Pseudomonas sp. v388]RRV09252.1 energy transducer TonB [Pseudomonas sp. v388]
MARLLTFLLIGFCIADVVQATGSYPVPRYMPMEDYPKELRGTSAKGNVTVRIFIQADGNVRFREVVSATDPRFIEAARKSVEQWQFEPWTPPASSPEGETVKVTISYTGKPEKGFGLASNFELKSVRCHQLNAQVQRSRDAWEIRRADKELKILTETEHFLSSNAVISQFLPLAERDALVSEFIRATPYVIEQCKKHPTRKYADFLPPSVKQYL